MIVKYFSLPEIILTFLFQIKSEEFKKMYKMHKVTFTKCFKNKNQIKLKYVEILCKNNKRICKSTTRNKISLKNILKPNNLPSSTVNFSKLPRNFQSEKESFPKMSLKRLNSSMQVSHQNVVIKGRLH